MTRLRRSGLSPRLSAIAGIDTAIIVESSPSMKKAQPTISGIRTRGRGSPAVWEEGPASLNTNGSERVPLGDHRAEWQPQPFVITVVPLCSFFRSSMPGLGPGIHDQP